MGGIYRRLRRVKGFSGLLKLAGDSAGNVMAMVAASLIPITAFVGCGVDMGRGYLAQARMQQACDAAALAGRRAMTSGAVDSTVRSEATKFFTFNFPIGTAANGGNAAVPAAFGADPFVPTISDGSDSAVVITASTHIKTTIMRMFGYSTLPVSVTCNAKQDFVNTDVMLVLDNTGSMAEDTSGTNVNSGPTSKIVGIRSAVMALYDQLAPVQALLQSKGLRMRYGIVPYSSAVNVGKVLYAADPTYLKADNWNFFSRVANYNNPTLVGTDGPKTVTTETYASQLSKNECNYYGSNKSYPTLDGSTFTSGVAPSDVTTTSYSLNSFSGTSKKDGTCVRNKSVYTTTYTTRYGFSGWTYKQTIYDVSSFIQGNSITYATSNAPSGTVASSQSYNLVELAAAQSAGTGVITSAATSSWDGCIEERQTDNSITATTTSAPAGAYDLDLSALPTDDTKRWKPLWDDISYYPSSGTSSSSGSKSGSACPVESRRLQTWDRTSLQSYVNTLVAAGNTYSDIGMIWGGRLLSTSGIFSVDNPTTYNNMPVARYLIIMTDGYINTAGSYYSGYGVEKVDYRATVNPYPGDTAAIAIHKQRFTLACNAVKSMGVQIWVVGYGAGVTLDSALQGCASDSTKAAMAADTNALIAKFTDIGKEIGALRLTK